MMRLRVIHFGELLVSSIITFIRMKRMSKSRVKSFENLRQEDGPITFQDYMIWFLIRVYAAAFTYLKSTIERLEKGMKYVQS